MLSRRDLRMLKKQRAGATARETEGPRKEPLSGGTAVSSRKKAKTSTSYAQLGDPQPEPVAENNALRVSGVPELSVEMKATLLVRLILSAPPSIIRPIPVFDLFTVDPARAPTVPSRAEDIVERVPAPVFGRSPRSPEGPHVHEGAGADPEAAASCRTWWKIAKRTSPRVPSLQDWEVNEGTPITRAVLTGYKMYRREAWCEAKLDIKPASSYPA